MALILPEAWLESTKAMQKMVTRCLIPVWPHPSKEGTGMALHVSAEHKNTHSEAGKK